MIFSVAGLVDVEAAARICCADAAGARAQIIAALTADPLFCEGVWPHRWSTLRLVYRALGAKLAALTNECAIDTIASMRLDVVACLFLSNPGDYDGGALVVEFEGGREAFKPALGTCILYPADAECRFDEVTRGACFTAHLSIQSLVRGAAERQILYDIGCAIHCLQTFRPNNPDEPRLVRCRERLLRLWAEP